MLLLTMKIVYDGTAQLVMHPVRFKILKHINEAHKKQFVEEIAKAIDEDAIEIWGDGLQTRSFLYIDECLEGTLHLMQSEYTGPFNIGSSHMITINELANMIIKIAGKKLVLHHIKGPLGVRGRTSDNKLINDILGWTPVLSTIAGLRKTYSWILEQVKKE